MKDGGGGGVGSVSKRGLKSGVGASLAKRESSRSTSMLMSIAWLEYSSIGKKSMNDGQLLCLVEYGKVPGKAGGVARSEASYKGSYVRKDQWWHSRGIISPDLCRLRFGVVRGVPLSK